MRILTTLAILSLSLFTSCTQESEPAAKTLYGDVSVEQAAALVDSGVAILDIRTSEEYNQNHIKGAKLINFMDESFQTNLKQLDNNEEYLIHCASGGRSGKSMPVFKELGFQKIYHLKAGFNGWESAGKPTSKPR